MSFSSVFCLKYLNAIPFYRHHRVTKKTIRTTTKTVYRRELILFKKSEYIYRKKKNKYIYQKKQIHCTNMLESGVQVH